MAIETQNMFAALGSLQRSPVRPAAFGRGMGKG